jgi:hypothetical protein
MAEAFTFAVPQAQRVSLGMGSGAAVPAANTGAEYLSKGMESVGAALAQAMQYRRQMAGLETARGAMLAAEPGAGGTTPPGGGTSGTTAPGAASGQPPAVGGAYGTSSGADRMNYSRGVQNFNPTNIGFGDWAAQHGATGGAGEDTGHKVAVFPDYQTGLNAAETLALNKYGAGAKSPMALIAGANGWTPGNATAAGNVAKTLGIGVNDDLNLNDPAARQSFIRALTLQEVGPAGAHYIFTADTPPAGQQPPLQEGRAAALEGPAPAPGGQTGLGSFPPNFATAAGATAPPVGAPPGAPAAQVPQDVEMGVGAPLSAPGPGAPPPPPRQPLATGLNQQGAGNAAPSPAAAQVASAMAGRAPPPSAYPQGPGGPLLQSGPGGQGNLPASALLPAAQTGMPLGPGAQGVIGAMAPPSRMPPGGPIMIPPGMTAQAQGQGAAAGPGLVQPGGAPGAPAGPAQGQGQAPGVQGGFAANWSAADHARYQNDVRLATTYGVPENIQKMAMEDIQKLRDQTVTVDKVYDPKTGYESSIEKDARGNPIAVLDASGVRHPPGWSPGTGAPAAAQPGQAQESPYDWMDKGIWNNAINVPANQTPGSAPTKAMREENAKAASALPGSISNNEAVKNYNTSLSALDQTIKASYRDDAQSDYTMIQNMEKVVNPTGVVRPVTVDAIKESQSIPDWLKGTIQQELFGKGQLSQATRLSILNIVTAAAEANRESAGNVILNGARQAVRLGMDPHSVLPVMGDMKTFDPTLVKTRQIQLPGSSPPAQQTTGVTMGPPALGSGANAPPPSNKQWRFNPQTNMVE